MPFSGLVPAWFELRERLRDVSRSDEAPHVDVARLAQHLAEQAIPLGAVCTSQRLAELRDAQILVPEKVRAAVLLPQVEREGPHDVIVPQRRDRCALAVTPLPGAEDRALLAALFEEEARRPVAGGAAGRPVPIRASRVV